MDTGEFEGLLYNMLLEEPFANHRYDMTDEKNNYTISDYFSQHFGIKIGETCTCLPCHTKKLKVLDYNSFILPMEKNITEGKKKIPISHERKTNLGKSCVTMTDLMVNFYEKLS